MAQLACPKCGTPMNHHADKVDYGAADDEPDVAAEFPGGVLEQIHQCPNPACGWIEARPAAST